MNFPLLADIDDILRAGIPLLLFFIWVIQQWLSEANKARQRPNRKAQQPAKPPEEVEEEIEQFLRRAAKRRNAGEDDEVEVLVPREASAQSAPASAQAAGKAKPPTATPVHPSASSPQAPKKRNRKPLSKLHRVSSKQVKDLLKEPPRAPSQDTSAASGGITGEQQVPFSHLSMDIADSEEFKHFSHDDVEEKKQSSAEFIASDLADIFANPNRIREAIILHEVLDRPVDRWE